MRMWGAASTDLRLRSARNACVSKHAHRCAGSQDVEP
jgi:hypothetical protein